MPNQQHNPSNESFSIRWFGPSYEQAAVLEVVAYFRWMDEALDAGVIKTDNPGIFQPVFAKVMFKKGFDITEVDEFVASGRERLIARMKKLFEEQHLQMELASKELLDELHALEELRALDEWESEKSIQDAHDILLYGSQETEAFKKAQARLEEIREAIVSYETDIVKLLKFPAMGDMTYDSTLAMVMALKKIDYLPADATEKEFSQALWHLEEKFLIAESFARKLALSGYSSEEKTRIHTAEKMFAIACDKGAADNEKRVALHQGLKTLEGIMDVPSPAITALKSRAGLTELER